MIPLKTPSNGPATAGGMKPKKAIIGSMMKGNLKKKISDAYPPTNLESRLAKPKPY